MLFGTRHVAATLLLVWSTLSGSPAAAQAPFATDDADVAARGTTHIEIWNQIDWLQPDAAPHYRQNTFNMRVNYGWTDRVELDIDAPLLTIFNNEQPYRVTGIGDTELGLKWNVREEQHGAKGLAAALGFYVELPTGEPTNDLGSGVVDVWAYLAVEKALTTATTLRLNGGYLFAGNTSTGVVGITTARGRVATMSGSLTRRMSARVSIGGEVAAAATTKKELERGQLQALLGLIYQPRELLTLTAGFVMGRFVASPRVGIQVGFSVDIPK
jgi:hypothetical protein